jgi:hypothetical protein
MRKVAHTLSAGPSHKLKSLQDLSIRVNAEVVEEVVQHADVRFDGRVYLHLHTLELFHPTLDLFDPLHNAFCLAHPVTNISLEGVVPVGELGKGRGSNSVAWPRGTMRIV